MEKKGGRPAEWSRKGNNRLMSAAHWPQADQRFLCLRILPHPYTGAAGFRQSKQELAPNQKFT
jgi:hypothetical protein